MSYAMDWSQDFCLSCDKYNHTAGPYCSEACRLLDLDKSTSSDPHTPLYSQSYTSTSTGYTWSAASSPSRSSGLYLPPAVNFSALRSAASGSSSLPTSPHAASTLYSDHGGVNHRSQAASHSHYYHSQSRKSLTTSSSRSSLSSISTGSSGLHGLSSQAIDQLRSYSNCFDQSREYKRRMTMA